ncbi:FtsX-like permease family protein [Aeromicrobium sp. 9AM]|uniref:FtsX-like permease family protein n=1 Tax=Aeromicrobium sp. 9AM TaxID=2653126 RepID=UPI0012F0E325|nr:FtsX-like permease family protein [Aeromicrobium sp. 9AM]VXB06221.1 membrane hypothetical protein [Aeromicrobium sp. 9AM]
MIGRLSVVGVRLAFQRDYASVIRAALLAAGIAIVTFVALCGVSAPFAASNQDARSHHLAVDVSTKDKPSGMSAVDPRLVAQRQWDGHTITRTIIAGAQGNDLRPPGIAANPGPGEMYASPDLRKLVKDNAVVRNLFHGYRVVGTVHAQGLTQPHELRAVLGANVEAPGLVQVVGFGTQNTDGGQDSNTVLNTVVTGFLAMVLGVPLVVVVAISARLSSRRRRGRIRTLRALGLSRMQVRWVMAVETLTVALPATVLGAATYWGALATFSAVPGTSFGWFTQDARLPLAVIVFVAACVMVVAGVAAALGASIDPRPLPSRKARRVSTVGRHAGLFVLAAGLVVLGAIRWMPSGAGGSNALVLWIGCGVVAAGLALSSNDLTVTFARAAMPRVKRGGTLIGLRINATEPGTATRMASILAVLTVLCIGTVAFTSVLNGGSSSNAAELATTRTGAPIAVNDFDGFLSLDTVMKTEGVQGVALIGELEGDKGNVPTVFASCAALERLTERKALRCDGGLQWLSSTGAPVSEETRATGSKTVVLGGVKTPLPVAADVVPAPALGVGFDGLLLAPSSIKPVADGNARSFLINVPFDVVPRTLALLSSAAPTAEFDLGEFAGLDAGSKQFPAQVTWLLLGMSASTVLGSVAILIAALGEAEARRNRLRGLYVLGAERNELARAHIVSTGVPLLTVAAAGVVVGWMVARAMVAFDDRASVPTHLFLALAGSGAVVAVLVTALTAPQAMRAFTPAEASKGSL